MKKNKLIVMFMVFLVICTIMGFVLKIPKYWFCLDFLVIIG